NVGCEHSYQEVSANTALNGAWTWTADTTMHAWQAAIATFKNAAVATPVIPTDTSGQAIRATVQDALVPNLLTETLGPAIPAPRHPLEWPPVVRVAVLSDFAPPNLLTLTLKGSTSPFLPVIGGAQALRRVIVSDFQPPNLLTPATL